MKVRHVGTSELIDSPDMIQANYEFRFEGIDPIYGAFKINIKGITVKEALIKANIMFESVLNDVHKERERLMTNVQTICN